MKKKWFFPLGILAVLVLAALIYTRPMPLEALCEADVTQCQSVFGYHFRALRSIAADAHVVLRDELNLFAAGRRQSLRR